MIAISYELHEGRQARGATYMTVDNPVVIATYLHFVLPKYDLGTPLDKPSYLWSVDDVPFEILEYFSLNHRFCQWYVEIAWQRLLPEMKTERLKRHWARFGDLDTPRYRKVDVEDGWDDWRGVRQVNLTRPSDVGRELGDLGGYLVRGQFGELGRMLNNLPKRVSLRNQTW